MTKPSGQLPAGGCCHTRPRPRPNLIYPATDYGGVHPAQKSPQKTTEEPQQDLLGAVLGTSYLIGHVIGKGSFGTIRLCNPGRPNYFVVAKVEVHRHGKRSRLFDEFSILRHLNGATGLPRVYYYSSLDHYNVMILDMLGPSLEELLQRVGGAFSVKTVALVGLQLLDRIKFLHERGILYRDIKGENLLIGHFDHHNRVYLVDFGLCKQVLKADGNDYTPVGTPRYMSLRTHEGRASTYRDDIESIGYLLIYFALGRLPWQGLPAASTDTKISMIRDRKNSISLPELCYGLPLQILHYVQAARNLHFNEIPDYNYFRGLMQIILRTCCNVGEPYLFNWQKPGISLTVLPKVKEPTAASQRREVAEHGVIDLRRVGKDVSGLSRMAGPRASWKSLTANASAKGSLSYSVTTHKCLVSRA